MKYNILYLLLFFSVHLYAQSDTIPGEAEYRKHFDCRYEPGNVLLVQKKGKTVELDPKYGLTKDGYVIRIEGVYDLEFADGKRFKTGIVKDITDSSITITSTFNENAAKYEGIKFELVTYPIKDIAIARFVSDRSLGFYAKRKIPGNYELIVKKVDKAKLCPAVLTFTKRNNEVKVCHYYLTSQRYDILFETNGFIDYLEYNVEWQ